MKKTNETKVKKLKITRRVVKDLQQNKGAQIKGGMSQVKTATITSR